MGVGRGSGRRELLTRTDLAGFVRQERRTWLAQGDHRVCPSWANVNGNVNFSASDKDSEEKTRKEEGRKEEGKGRKEGRKKKEGEKQERRRKPKYKETVKEKGKEQDSVRVILRRRHLSRNLLGSQRPRVSSLGRVLVQRPCRWQRPRCV